MKPHLRNKLGKYFIELSIVVAGIAITLAANSFINTLNEKKDMRRYVEAVRLELEENLELVKSRRAFYDETTKFGKYLNSVKYSELNADSLQSYRHVSNQISNLSFKTGAFEMFKSSGAMRLVKDKNMLISLTDAYADLETLKESNDMYMQRKMNELYEAFSNQSGDAQLEIDFTLPQYKRLYFFYAAYINLDDEFNRVEKLIESTLEQMK